MGTVTGVNTMERDDHASANCPYLMPKVSARTAIHSLAVYCRLPNGRVRIPTSDQLKSLCVDGQHHDCPGYRRFKRRRGNDRVIS